jgi:hypothetical protein
VKLFEDTLGAAVLVEVIVDERDSGLGVRGWGLGRRDLKAIPNP